jgi:uncharacterized membrane protein YgcG
MKKILFWAAAIVAVLAVVWYFGRRKTAKANGTVATIGTQRPLDSYFSVWDSFNAATQNATSANVRSAIGSLFAVANNFGKNDGGNSRVSISGSSAGGTQSSGSGAGVPWDGGFNSDFSLGFA